MLSLSRKKDQSIIIVVDNKEIEILVSHISQSKVQIKVAADPSIKIYRSEMLDKIRKSEAADFQAMKDEIES
jgi:carbon storage regulator CsrA